MRQNFGWALSNFSSAGFSEEKHFPALLLFINELTSDITKHPNNQAVSDLRYINKWWCLWKILQTFFQGCGKPNKEKKKEKNLQKQFLRTFVFWGPKTYRTDVGWLLWIEGHCLPVVILVLGKGKYSHTKQACCPNWQPGFGLLWLFCWTVALQKSVKCKHN